MATRIAGARLTRYILSHPDKELILPALRGPDEDGPEGQALKISVTGRIRFIVYGQSYIRGVCTGSPLAVTGLKKIKELLVGTGGCPCDAHTPHCNQHFRRHLYEAVTVTKTHEIWGGLGQKLADILRPA